jgi:para-aminobenzoate synthetase
VHGVPSKISHDGTGLFIDLPEVTTMMRYHSLSISQRAVGQPASESEIFDSLNQSGRLGFLVVNGKGGADDLGQMDGHLVANGWSDDGVVMSIRHTLRPIYGIQFHPESCGSIEGSQILSQFLTETHLAA